MARTKTNFTDMTVSEIETKIEELKKESEAALQAKNREINQIQAQLQDIDKQRQELQSNMDEKVAAREAELRSALEVELAAERERLEQEAAEKARVEAEEQARMEAARQAKEAARQEEERKRAEEEARRRAEDMLKERTSDVEVATAQAELAAADRLGGFVECELSLTEEQAKTEALRCLRCDLEFTKPAETKEAVVQVAAEE